MERFRRKGARPLVWAHRGAVHDGEHLENTMPAFEQGVRDGADGLELDVRTTSDGEVVVMHDPDLARITDGRDRRAVATLNRREFQAVQLSAGVRPPTLEELLEWAETNAALLNVELKHDTHDKAALVRGVRRLLRGRRVAARVIFSTFEPELLARAALALPEVPRGFLVHDGQELARTFVAPGVGHVTRAFAMHPQRTLCSPARIAEWQRQGFAVNVWTVNDPGEAVDLAGLGVDGLIGDDPKTLLEALVPAANAGTPACY